MRRSSSPVDYIPYIRIAAIVRMDKKRKKDRKSIGGIHDAYEDSFLEEPSVSDHKAPSKKGYLPLLCPCCLCCCGVCNSWILGVKIRKNLIEENACSEKEKNREWITQQRKKQEEGCRIETGSLKTLKSSHKYDESSLSTMEKHRQAAGIKHSVPRLKTKNMKKSNIFDRKRKGALQEELKLPPKFDENKASLGADLTVHGQDYTARVVAFLVNKDMSVNSRLSISFHSLSLSTDVDNGRSSVEIDVERGSVSKDGDGVNIEVGNAVIVQKSVDSDAMQEDPGSGNSGKSANSTMKSANSTVKSANGTERSANGILKSASSRKTSRKNSTLKSFPSTSSDRHIIRLSKITELSLERDWNLSKRSAGVWLKRFNTDKFKNAARHTVDRWFPVFYTSSSDTMEEFDYFCCVLTRALLHHYKIVYEERDCAVDKGKHEKELAKRLQTDDKIKVPYMVVSGIPLGDCRVVYFLHKTNRMKEVFGTYMMPTPDVYSRWMLRFKPATKEVLNLNVPLKEYPCLKAVSADKRKIKLKTAETVKLMKEGGEFHSMIKTKWKNRISLPFSDHDYWMFAVNMAACKMAYEIMDSIYWTSLFPKDMYSNDWEYMKKCVDEHFGRKKKILPNVMKKQKKNKSSKGKK